MAKEELTKQNIILTLDQLRTFAKEIEAVGEAEFLISRKVIRVINDEWVVMEYEGLKGTAVEELEGYEYRNDIPMNFWSEVLKQVEKYMSREFRKKKGQEKGLEQLAKMEGL